MITPTAAAAVAAFAAGSPIVGDGAPLLTAANCWDSVEFKSYWDSVYAVTFQVDYTIIPDDGWMLDMIVEGFNDSEWHDSVAHKVIEAFREDFGDYPDLYDWR
jgi:hypothetical protein